MLEQLLSMVIDSPASAVEVAKVAVRICSTALTVIQAHELEREVADLRAFVVARFPDARERFAREGRLH